VVSLYAQVHKLEEVEELVEKHGIKYPIAMDIDSFWDVGYQAPALPRVWIIGTDGKIKFAGNRGYAEVLEKELAKVKFSGLGKEDVVDALKPAARLMAEGKYAEAYKAAEKVFDETEDTAAEDDADWIMRRIDERMRALIIRAETAEVMREFVLAKRCWDELAKFKGIRGAEEGAERLKKLNESEEVAREIKARRALKALMLSLDVEFQSVNDEEPEDVRKMREKCLAAYRKFVEEFKDTAAAERAEELVEIFKGILGVEE
jgi:hypothetical protein